MTRILLILALHAALHVALFGGAAPASAGQMLPGPIPARVERVVDGDTLSVRAQVWIGQELEVLVRLRGIDAPELGARCPGERTMAEDATARLAGLVEGEPVLLVEVEGDKYFGRVVASVRTQAGDDLSALLLATGRVRLYEGGGRLPWCGETGDG